MIPIKETYHFYHKGVDSRPAWAYDEARKQIARKWAEFMKAMPDTANVKVQDVAFDNLGGTTSRLGVFTSIGVTGAGSKTKGATPFRGGSWETWFDVTYEMQLVFISQSKQKEVGEGLSIEEVNRRIAAGAGN
ncbi:hypothetical protein THARTR1_08096 [Trichoderma harzianum]|uniref:Uncharacterized protein n=1 Tax=Trichoderma harzianum TaxID=5544 RepID=A0A2K0U0A2_TRIHA|nr:hypothetical protein THARTR1_08096 [Trichoderma harzianum]